MSRSGRHRSAPRIDPKPIDATISLTELVDRTFLAYNGARLREACQVFTREMLADDVVVGLSVSGALTPAGLGIAAFIPLIENGFVDWIVSTGANLYHDTHFGLGMDLRAGSPFVDDAELREEGIVRIYDVFLDLKHLLDTDSFYRQVVAEDEFQRPMSTAEFHYRLGRYVLERERVLGGARRSLLGAAHEYGVPIYTSSPGDSAIGMNVAALALVDNKLTFDVCRDVNETAAIVLDAKRHDQRSGVLMLGGGSPKNFILQTEPQIQEVMGLTDKGHDFYVQITDARPDTGGLSGATPSEAVSWGKVDPDALPNTVVCYLDTTVALPILTAYAMANHPPRPHRRLYARREEMLGALEREYKSVLAAQR
jgi:deoxyhypusine synthase